MPTAMPLRSVLVLAVAIVGGRASEQAHPNDHVLPSPRLQSPSSRINADNQTDLRSLRSLSPFVSKQLEGNAVDLDVNQLLQEVDAGVSKMNKRQITKFKEYMTSMKEFVMKNQAASQKKPHLDSAKVFYDPSTQKPLASFDGYTYSAIIYHDPPFVSIQDYFANSTNPADQDPGNLNQTRTPGNGKLSGLSIDMLGALSTTMGVSFKYYYPCNVQLYNSQKYCNTPTKNESLNLFSGTPGYFGSIADMCGAEDRCMVVGPVKITSDITKTYRLTQPFMESGFVMAVLESKSNPSFMAAFDPFDWLLWFLVVIEIILCGVLFMWTEGYGTNQDLWGSPAIEDLQLGLCERIVKIIWNLISQSYDAIYWSFTLLLGAGDKAPTTNAGRLVVSFQLLFALILVSMYTGNLATFLFTIPMQTKVTQFDDFVDPASFYYNKKNSICISTLNPSMQSWLDVKKSDLIGTGQSNFNIITNSTIEDCLFSVYTGKATATFFDEPTVLYYMNRLYSSGMCGDGGGYCTDRTKIDQESCVCPTRDSAKKCQNPNNNKWYAISGSVVTAGNIFNPFGYGLVFHRNSTDYQGFSQAIEYIKQIGLLASIEDNNIPGLSTMSCSSLAGGSIQLTFSNIQGLFTLIMALLFAGLCVGLLEQIIALVMYCMKPCLKKKELSVAGSRKNSMVSVSSDLMLRKPAPGHKSLADADTKVDSADIQVDLQQGNGEIGEEKAQEVEEQPSPEEIEMHKKITELQRGLAEIEEIIQTFELEKSSEQTQDANEAPANPLAATWQSFHANVRSFLGSKADT